MTRDPQSPSVCLIVLNYNGRRLLGRFLPSLVQTDYSPLEVVVVDNASTDDSVGWLKARWPRVTLLQSPGNLAWAGGNNLGIRYALDKGHRYIVLANNDIEPHPGWLRRAVELATAKPEYGIIGFRLFNQEAARPAYEAACRELAPLSWQETTHVPGCSLFCDAAMFHAIGLFDERYIFYAEENDFEIRAFRAGWRAAEINTPVWHVGEASTRRLGLKRAYLSMRNYIRLHLKLDGVWRGLWAVAVVFNRACNPWLRLDFEADYTLLRYRPRGPLLNGVLAVAALGWNLAMLPWTLGAGWQARRRIDRCRAARRG